jgi:repressor LexA
VVLGRFFVLTASGYRLPAQPAVGEASDRNLIMLRVDGESMINAAIADGDWVVVRRESDVENGDIVAAMLVSDTSGDSEATVKTFKKVDGHVWLIPHSYFLSWRRILIE